MHDPAMHPAGLDARYAELHIAIVQKQGIAWLEIVPQRGDVHPNAMLIARVAVEAGVDKELRAVLKPHRTAAKARDADFRALQIAQQRHAAA